MQAKERSLEHTLETPGQQRRPERLQVGENFYSQQPFALAIEQIGETYPLYSQEVTRTILSRLAAEVVKEPPHGEMPYLEDSCDVGELLDRIAPSKFREIAQHSGCGKIDEPTAIKIGVSLLEALQQFPKWAAYVNNNVTIPRKNKTNYKADGTYVDPPASFGAEPAKTYVCWVQQELENQRRQQAWGIKEAFSQGYTRDAHAEVSRLDSGPNPYS